MVQMENRMPDKNYLWEGLQQDSTKALEQLYRLYFKDLYNYGKTMSSDVMLIEDAIQETFINIWKYRKRMSSPKSEKAYILRSFRNQMLDLIRFRSRVVFPDEDLHFNFDISFEQKVIEGEEVSDTVKRVKAAFDQLTNRQREIIYYRFFKGLSFEEIGDIMNMQTRATYKLTARALASLRKIMDAKVYLLLFGLS